MGISIPTADLVNGVHQFAAHLTAHHRICRSTASRSPVLTRGGISVPPTVTYPPYRVSGSTLTADGRQAFLVAGLVAWNSLLDFIRDSTSITETQTFLGIYLKRICSGVASASSALGVLSDYALYKSTYSLIHSLTFDHHLKSCFLIFLCFWFRLCGSFAANPMGCQRHCFRPVRPSVHALPACLCTCIHNMLACVPSVCILSPACRRHLVTLPPVGERSIVMSMSCVFVSPRSYLWNYMPDLH